MSDSSQGRVTPLTAGIIAMSLLAGGIFIFELNKQVEPAIVETVEARHHTSAIRHMTAPPPGFSSSHGDVMRQIPEASLVQSRTQIKKSAREKAMLTWNEKRKGNSAPVPFPQDVPELHDIHQLQMEYWEKRAQRSHEADEGALVTLEDVQRYRAEFVIIE